MPKSTRLAAFSFDRRQGETARKMFPFDERGWNSHWDANRQACTSLLSLVTFLAHCKSKREKLAELSAVLEEQSRELCRLLNDGIACGARWDELPDTSHTLEVLAAVSDPADETFVVHRKVLILVEELRWNESITIDDEKFFNAIESQTAKAKEFCRNRYMNPVFVTAPIESKAKKARPLTQRQKDAIAVRKYFLIFSEECEKLVPKQRPTIEKFKSWAKENSDLPEHSEKKFRDLNEYGALVLKKLDG